MAQQLGPAVERATSLSQYALSTRLVDVWPTRCSFVRRSTGPQSSPLTGSARVRLDFARRHDAGVAKKSTEEALPFVRLF